MKHLIPVSCKDSFMENDKKHVTFTYKDYGALF